MWTCILFYVRIPGHLGQTLAFVVRFGVHCACACSWTLAYGAQKLCVGCALKENVFCFKVNPCDKPNSMRGVLSCVSFFHDSMGFAVPVLLPAKQILEACWRRKMKWDDILAGDLLKFWIRWKSLLPLMTPISIPRCFYQRADHDDACTTSVMLQK